MLIKPLLFSTLETALNRYLTLGRNVEHLLTPLAGKTIAITILPFKETVYFYFSRDSIQLLDQLLETPDTHLTGTLWAFGLMGLGGNPMHSLFSGKVTMMGDVHVGRKFQDVFKKLDLKLEQRIADIAGNAFAHNLSQVVTGQQAWLKDSLETFRLNTAEFLQEETRELPPATELDIFYHNIDLLRTDVDRLQSKIERLAAKFADNKNQTN